MHEWTVQRFARFEKFDALAECRDDLGERTNILVRAVVGGGRSAMIGYETW